MKDLEEIFRIAIMRENIFFQSKSFNFLVIKIQIRIWVWIHKEAWIQILF
jgi:hypothetical protein